MSEARRRDPEPRRSHPRAQHAERPWSPGEEAIDLREAVKSRRRLDAQGSTDLIPTAGPDAASDQGPAIKAVWEPMEPAAAGAHHSRRGSLDGRGRSRRGRTRAAGKRRTLIFGGAAAVVLVGAAVADLNDGTVRLERGAAPTILPMVSDSASPSEQSQLGDPAAITFGPSGQASHSPSHSPSPSRTPSPSASTRSRPGPTPTVGPATSAPASSGPTPAATTSSPPSCFLIFCS